MDFLDALDFDRIGAVAIALVVCFLVITGRLVWYKQLERAEKRADRWEEIALEALMTGARAGVVAAETAADVVTSLHPAPEKTGKG